MSCLGAGGAGGEIVVGVLTPVVMAWYISKSAETVGLPVQHL